jgi:hypothetical protein
MGISFAKLTQDQLNYTKYKWEFLRRNEDYRKGYQEFKEALERACQDQGIDIADCPTWGKQFLVVESPIKEELEGMKKAGLSDLEILESRVPKKTAKKVIGWLDDPVRKKNQEEMWRMSEVFGEAEKSLLKPFCNKWQIKAPMNPQVSYDEIIKLLVEKGWVKKNIHPRLYDLMTLSKNHPVMMGKFQFETSHFSGAEDFILTNLMVTIGFNYGDEMEVLEGGNLPITINLNFSKRLIIQELGAILTKWKEEYEGWAGSIILRSDEDDPIEKAKTRQKKWLNDRKKYYPTYYFDNYNDYLRVWDLKNQGYSYAKIADKLDLNSRDTARNYYKTANKLIEQGIGWYDDSR